jgi:tetratricopeptide (TPR) repeat protein
MSSDASMSEPDGDPGQGTGGEVVQLTRGRISAPTVVYDDVRVPSPAPGDDRVPDKLGRYVVLDVVGVGGMGVVCTAYDPKLDRKVALKLLRRREHDDAARVSIGQARLQREARALAKLKHPNVVAVHDVDIVDDRLYIAMEYVDGQTLDHWLETTARPWRDIVGVFIQAARGLVAAHAANITHRDFKPANVRIEPSGRVVVLDFGLALANEGLNTTDEHPLLDPITDLDLPVPELNRRLTAAGRRVGTPAYMAPEQILGHAVGPATDQFSFGASLYEALYGVLPFRGDASTAMWNAVEGAVAPPPKDRVVPPWLHRVVLRLLARLPEQRFADMHAVIGALEHGLGRRTRTRLVAGGLVGLLVLGAGAWGYMRARACPGASARIDARWDATRRDALERDFEATAAPFAAHAAARTIAALDERASAWRAAHVEICEATRVRGEQSDALLDHRMACLDASLLEFGAHVDVLAETDVDLVEHAVAATLALGDPGRCREDRPDDADAAPSPGEADRVLALRQQDARARALIGAMRIEPAYAEASALWAAAAQLEHAPTRVAARETWARALELRGDFAEAGGELVALIQDAAAHRLFEAEATAWTRHLQLLGNHLHRPEQALDERLAAEVAVTRAGDRPDQVASLAHALGVTLSAHGDHELAAEQFSASIRTEEASPSPSAVSIAGARNDLGIALARLGRHREAEDAFAAALEANRRTHGATHPLVATNSLNLGHAIAEGRGDWDQAQALYASALAIREAVFGPEHPACGEVLVAQGSLARRRGDHAGAIAALRRAVALFGGPDGHDLRVGMALNNLGASQLAQGDAAAAIESYSQAIALFDREGATKHLSRMRAHLRRCEAEIVAGALAAAAADCDRAEVMIADIPKPIASDLQDLAPPRAAIAAAAR